MALFAGLTAGKVALMLAGYFGYEFGSQWIEENMSNPREKEMAKFKMQQMQKAQKAKNQVLTKLYKGANKRTDKNMDYLKQMAERRRESMKTDKTMKRAQQRDMKQLAMLQGLLQSNQQAVSNLPQRQSPLSITGVYR